MIDCECCGRSFIQLYRHLSQYSVRCKNYYFSKYGSENNWPEGSTKKAFCLRCGKHVPDHRAKRCSICQKRFFNVMSNSEISKRMGESLKSLYKKEPYRLIELGNRTRRMFQTRPDLVEKQRNYMLNGGAIKACTANNIISRPQQELFNLIEDIFETARLNFPVGRRLLDIAIPNLRIDVEYDGSYWHQNKDLDHERDLELKILDGTQLGLRIESPKKKS